MDQTNFRFRKDEDTYLAVLTLDKQDLLQLES
jgi:hypothetical protein